MGKKRKLLDEYRFPGFRPRLEVRRVLCRKCGKEKTEKLEWIASNPFYTKQFAHYVGRKCRAMTVKDVAKELKLDWEIVKALDKEYMEKQLYLSAQAGRNPVAAPRVIGIDEISLRKGHVYRIVVSDLERHRPIWFGGKDRSEESLDIFYRWLGAKKSKKIRLAVMDMWKAFEKSTRKNVSHAAILYDKFHVMRHLGEALDTVRKMEYARLSGSKGRNTCLRATHRQIRFCRTRRTLLLMDARH